MHLFGCLTFTAVLLATASAQGIQSAVNNIGNAASNALNFANNAATGFTSNLGGGSVSNVGALGTGTVGTGGFSNSILGTGTVGTGGFSNSILGTGTVGTGTVGIGNFGVQGSPNTQAWNLVENSNLWNIPASQVPLTAQNTVATAIGMPQVIGSSTFLDANPPLTHMNNLITSQGFGATPLNMPVTTLYPNEPAYNMQVPLYNSFANLNTVSTANPGFIVHDATPVLNTGSFQLNPTFFGSNFDMDMDTDLDMNMNSFVPFFQAPASTSSQQYVVCAPVTS